MNTDWDARYLDLARHVARWSKDPSTQVGAVVVGRDRRHIAIGYNGFPKGIADDNRLFDRDVKYTLIQHAERNVLDNAVFDLAGATLIVTLHPCVECAKSIVSKGISRVVCSPIPPGMERWEQQADLAALILNEAGVALKIM